MKARNHACSFPHTCIYVLRTRLCRKPRTDVLCLCIPNIYKTHKLIRLIESILTFDSWFTFCLCSVWTVQNKERAKEKNTQQVKKNSVSLSLSVIIFWNEHLHCKIKYKYFSKLLLKSSNWCVWVCVGVIFCAFYAMYFALFTMCICLTWLLMVWVCICCLCLENFFQH